MSNTKAASLPADFLWGFATASYQIEGAIEQDGRGPTIWEAFTAQPRKIADGSSGVTACDPYNRSAEDIALLKETGAQAYRFSIACQPEGHRSLHANDLLAAGIGPLVTLYHWDLPLALEERYGGLLNKVEFVADFANYARIVYQTLARKVKHWSTFNEPWCSSILGYASGLQAPGRTSDRSRNGVGDSSTEPWIVGHNILLAHAHAVKIYREEVEPKYGGEIGVTLNGDWVYPYDPDSEEDIRACERKLDFSIAWFGDPIYLGDYPASMCAQLGSRLSEFTTDEIALVKGSNDFYGMNHYCANYIRHVPGTSPATDFEGSVELLFENKRGEKIGPDTQSAWLKPNPAGFRHLLGWISKRYGYPRIIVTESGTSIKGENDLPVDELLNDEFRVQYFQNYVKAMAEACGIDGVDVRGYMGWSLMDNFEWADGYETRFGVTFVDYENGQKRYPKKSAKELKNILAQYM